jgi:hypothetical protein
MRYLLLALVALGGLGATTALATDLHPPHPSEPHPGLPHPPVEGVPCGPVRFLLGVWCVNSLLITVLMMQEILP